MDTDSLSTEAYDGIIIASEEYDRSLTLNFALLAEEFEEEDAYLEAALDLVKQLQKADKEELTDVLFGDEPDMPKLRKVLKTLARNIVQVKSIPVDKRKYEF